MKPSRKQTGAGRTAGIPVERVAVDALRVVSARTGAPGGDRLRRWSFRSTRDRHGTHGKPSHNPILCVLFPRLPGFSHDLIQHANQHRSNAIGVVVGKPNFPRKCRMTLIY